ncbi:hypothetical protein C0992_000711 [Termitomyces sp. T32_za158]|nr:hypothetical protein C0992_000711 [Termitomyces sp. T32_za158]
MGEAATSGYCPLDLFSEDEGRVKKAIRGLWDIWTESNGTVNNLKIFVQGQKVAPSVASLLLLSDTGLEVSHEDLRETFADALLPVLLRTPVLRILCNLQRSLDTLDIEGLFKLWRLVGLSRQELHGIGAASFPSLSTGSSSIHLTSFEPNITDWTHFLDMYLSSSAEFNHANPAPEHLCFYVLAYLLSATFKDCSIIVRLDRLQLTAPVRDVKPEQIMIIDLDPKDMTRLGKWEKLDQEIVGAYVTGGGRKPTLFGPSDPSSHDPVCPLGVVLTSVSFMGWLELLPKGSCPAGRINTLVDRLQTTNSLHRATPSLVIGTRFPSTYVNAVETLRSGRLPVNIFESVTKKPV